MEPRPTLCRAVFSVALVLLGASAGHAQDTQLAGNVTFNGLFQAWYLAADNLDETFKIRRSEFKFTGPVSPRVKWTLMVDPAKALSRGTPSQPDQNPNLAIILQDMFVTLTYHRRLNIDAGRFKIPLGLEGLQSSGDLHTERALFSSDRSRGGAYGDVRDAGVMAHGVLAGSVGYQLGLFGGSGDAPNDLPDDDAAALAARMFYRPSQLPGVQIGASRLWSAGADAARAQRDRTGGELRYVTGPLVLQTEYMTGRDGPFRRNGYYAQFVVALRPGWDATLRYDTWDPDIRSETTPSSVMERDYIAGFDFPVDGRHVVLQVNYVRRTFRHGTIAPSHVGAMRLQAAW